MAKSDEKYTKDEQERIDAVNRCLRGERPTKVCKSIGRSRTWLYKWIKRYNSIGKNSKKKWFKEDLRSPKNMHWKTDPEIEKVVVNVRKSLVEGKTEDTKYRYIGADEIQFRMHELDYSEDEMPSLSTIKRIIKRNKLLVRKRKRYVRCKSKKRYTLLNPAKVNEVHQMDFVGPRYIKSYGAISSLNLIDVVGNKVRMEQYVSRNMDYVIEFLLDCWTKNTIPKYLQMDNGAYFIGDLRHPRHFSRVVRLCLYLGVEPVFIAARKPWMNGTIEDFNGDFERKLWQREQFKDLKHLRREAKIFLKRHNSSQDWKHRNASLEAIADRKIPKDFEIDTNNLPITEGEVHFIREVKKEGKINVLNEDFDVDKSLAYEYVWATIDTRKEQLHVYHRGEKAKEARLVKVHEYQIEDVKEFNMKF